MKKVMVFGTFDLLHEGHLHMLQEAKQYGDYLVVVVARDATVEVVKKEKPLYNEKERMEKIITTGLADKVRLGGVGDKYEVIREETPDVIALGYDQEAFVEGLKEQFEIPIVRLSAYKPDEYKSSILKQKLKQ